MPATVREKKMARLGLRLTPRQQRLIQQAADVENKSVSEFILDSTTSAATDTLFNQRFFLLDEAEWQKFQDALDRPAEIKPGLKKLLTEKAPWE